MDVMEPLRIYLFGGFFTERAGKALPPIAPPYSLRFERVETSWAFALDLPVGRTRALARERRGGRATPVGSR
jgi:hypothetical protein